MKLKSMMTSICILMVGTALLILTGCDGSSSSNNSNSNNEDPAEPSFEQATFTNPTQIDNKYLPLNPNTVQLYQVETEDGVER